ncbi:DoxX family membrane protein [Natronomonas sp. EA1]|uniref:DoxX family membrane protein n=1 Tax=Natronomonas sp. EA1 TaxID=3421655 RepID=UPI003EB6EDF7
MVTIGNLLPLVFDTAGAGELFLLGRLLFGGVLAFMGLNHFMNADMMVPYSEAKGVPAAGLMVPFTGGLLLFGGLSVIAGAYVVVGAGGLAVFLVSSAVLMHDFWAVGEEEQMTEMTQFLKNMVMAGGALAFLALAGETWPYAANVGLF